MSRTLTASDRSALIRLASTMPVGSPERKAILAGLSKSASPDGYTYGVYYQWDDGGEAVDDPEKGYGIKPRHADSIEQIPDAVHSSSLSDTLLDDHRISKNLKWTPRMHGGELWLESKHPDEPMMYYRVFVRRNDRQRLSPVEVKYLTKAFR